MAKTKEIERLEAAVDEAAEKMKAKLREKFYAGYRGWAKPGMRSLIRYKLSENFAREDYIDVMNCAMFLYRLKKRGEKDVSSQVRN